MGFAYIGVGGINIIAFYSCTVFREDSTNRIVRLWTRELCLRLASNLDYRHLRSPLIAALHFPEHGMDSARGRSLLLDPW